MVIYSGFTHWKWWFSIVMLVYQRVNHHSVTQKQRHGPWDFSIASAMIKNPIKKNVKQTSHGSLLPYQKMSKKPAMEAFFPIKKYVKTQPRNDFSLSKKCQKTQPWKPGARLYCVMVMLASSLFSGVLVAFVAQAMVGWLRKWGGFSSKNGGFKQQKCGNSPRKVGVCVVLSGKKGRTP